MSAPLRTLPGDKIFDDLLKLLKDHPEIIDQQLNLNAIAIASLLPGLELSADTMKFLEDLSTPLGGPAVVQFSQASPNTGYMCAKTVLLACLKNTAHQNVVYAQP